MQEEEYLLGLTLLTEAYSDGSGQLVVEGKSAVGLSYYGLCVALVQRKFKPAIELCKMSLDSQFYHPDHYVNLSRVYEIAGNRKKSLDVVLEGLKVLPDEAMLIERRNQLGKRSRPAVPFLSRTNPINRALGRARHAKKPQK
ncbi:MAG TPA: hypothetical protein VNM92_15710 [Thermoanaerobaculia bacterium]|nr:hypothetical protein [Thermoanaerobaculia bacterium]